MQESTKTKPSTGEVPYFFAYNYYTWFLGASGLLVIDFSGLFWFNLRKL